MKEVCKIIILSSVLLVAASCSKKKVDPELKYTEVEFNHLANETKAARAIGVDAINFADYSPGVNLMESKSLEYKRLPFFAISFETETQARNEALRLNQYYARNWLFDRVEGEPILEDYVIVTFKATNPKRKIQRVPKMQTHKTQAPAEHH